MSVIKLCIDLTYVYFVTFNCYCCQYICS